jgi:hypothetical protein
VDLKPIFESEAQKNLKTKESIFIMRAIVLLLQELKPCYESLFCKSHTVIDEFILFDHSP